MFAKGSAPFILVPLAAAALLAGWALVYGVAVSRALVAVLMGLAAIALFLGVFGLWFFRDPEREPTGGIVCPADGKVLFVEPHENPLVGPGTRIAVFMSPLNVHVNRAPVSGRLVSLEHHPGGYLPAFDKESERNERVETVWEADGSDAPADHGAKAGDRFLMVQIAGAVARRIVPWVAPGDTRRRGERMGLIRYGSRVDLWMPAGYTATVRPGERVRAGTTRLAVHEH